MLGSARDRSRAARRCRSPTGARSSCSPPIETARPQTRVRAAEASVTGLRITLSADHGGLPAGHGDLRRRGLGARRRRRASRERRAGDARAQAEAEADARRRRQRPPGAPQEPGTSVAGKPPELVRPAPEVTARLTDGGYVFPVFGPASFGDTFGAPRADLASGWHHGEDIVAPLGTPILAVADGTVFGVGWNELGGWKLWLRDALRKRVLLRAPLRVLAAGRRRHSACRQVTCWGSWATRVTPPGWSHLHFEIHPADLLYLGLRRRRGAVPLPRRLAASRGRLLRARVVGTSAAPAAAEASRPRPARCCSRSTTSRARAGWCPARSSVP